MFLNFNYLLLQLFFRHESSSGTNILSAQNTAAIDSWSFNGDIKQCASSTLALTSIHFQLSFSVFKKRICCFSYLLIKKSGVFIKLVGYTNTPEQMYDYWIFKRLKVTEISGRATAERSRRQRTRMVWLKRLKKVTFPSGLPSNLSH